MRINKNFGEVNVNYNESFWTGRSEISFNNVPLTKVNRKTFILQQKNDQRIVTLKGNFISGLKMNIEGNNEIYYLLKYKLYEKLIIFLPIITIAIGFFCGMIFAGIAALCSGCVMVVNAFIMQSKMPSFFKVLLGLLFFLIISAAWITLYVAFLQFAK